MNDMNTVALRAYERSTDAADLMERTYGDQARTIYATKIDGALLDDYQMEYLWLPIRTLLRGVLEGQSDCELQKHLNALKAAAVTEVKDRCQDDGDYADILETLAWERR